MRGSRGTCPTFGPENQSAASSGSGTLGSAVVLQRLQDSLLWMPFILCRRQVTAKLDMWSPNYFLSYCRHLEKRVPTSNQCKHIAEAALNHHLECSIRAAAVFCPCLGSLLLLGENR